MLKCLWGRRPCVLLLPNNLLVTSAGGQMLCAAHPTAPLLLLIDKGLLVTSAGQGGRCSAWCCTPHSPTPLLSLIHNACCLLISLPADLHGSHLPQM